MKTSELEKCLSILLRTAVEKGIEDVEPEHDGYWTVTAPAWRNVYVDPPPTPSVGSFSDDEEELRKLIASPDRVSAVDFERVSHLLRLLSDKLADE
jgi:hypothetical protein